MKAMTRKSWDTWQLNKFWRWGYGILALNAARSGRPDKSVDFLSDGNLKIGDVGSVMGTPQVSSPYLPTTSRILYAIALIANG